MKSSLRIVPTSSMSEDDWLNYRHNGLGASDVGTVMGLDNYKSSLELFYDKIGATPRYSFESLAAFLGSEQEEFIAKIWQYWDGTVEGMMRNYREKRVIRRCQKVNAYVHNPEYPWLFVSLDRKINKHDNKGEGALELKTMSGYVAAQWEAGMPPAYVLQNQTQMLVCEFTYGELVVLEDNRQFHVLPFERHNSICQTIIEKTKDFWDRVVKGRQLLNIQFDAERRFDMAEAELCQMKIDELAPGPDGSMAYENFLSKKYASKTLKTVKFGTLTELEIAKRHKTITEQLGELEKERAKLQQELKVAMGPYESLDFKTEGKVLWSKGNRDIRYFRNLIK